MQNGHVKWFNDARGYGFITLETGSEVFVHHSAIQGEGYRTLAEGEAVRLEVVNGEKGPRAAKVERMNAPSA